MGRLLEQLKPHVSAGSIVRGFIESVEQLPGLDGWSLPEPVGTRFLEVFRWGHAICMTRSIAGVEELQGALGHEIVTAGEPAPETLAEIAGAGLCVVLGSIAAGRIPRGPDRTADWRMVWPEAEEVDVEVTFAKKKKAHALRQTAARKLAADVFDSGRSFDLVIDLVDPTNGTNCEAVKTAVDSISCGQTKSVSGSWAIRAEPTNREPTVIWTAGQDSAPDWWSPDLARSCAFSQQVAVRDAAKAPPQLRIWFGLPYAAYVNPVVRKADAPQGTDGLPFLVVVDVSHLPGAFSEIPRVAAGFLPFWKAVGGILIFQSIIDFERVGWAWRLVRNPHAAVRLPQSLCNGRADLPNTTDSYVKAKESAQDSSA